MATKKKAISTKRGTQGRTSQRVPTFVDRNFRLTVIDSLWNQGHFKKELADARRLSERSEDYTIHPSVRRAMDGLSLTPELLANVTSIAPDGGDEIYEVMMRGWDGSSEELYITSIDDVALLPNLERVSLYAVCGEGIDLAPLAKVPKLKEVAIDLVSPRNTEVLEVLAKRGVKVR